MKAAFAQSVLDSANGFFEEIIDIEAAGRRRLDDRAGVDVSYTGVARMTAPRQPRRTRRTCCSSLRRP